MTNNLFSEKALTEKAKKYAYFEAPENLHYLTVPLVKKGYHAGYKQCKEDLRAKLIEHANCKEYHQINGKKATCLDVLLALLQPSFPVKPVEKKRLRKKTNPIKDALIMQGAPTYNALKEVGR